jgi:hypothetical protein
MKIIFLGWVKAVRTKKPKCVELGGICGVNTFFQSHSLLFSLQSQTLNQHSLVLEHWFVNLPHHKCKTPSQKILRFRPLSTHREVKLNSLVKNNNLLAAFSCLCNKDCTCVTLLIISLLLLTCSESLN